MKALPAGRTGTTRGARERPGRSYGHEHGGRRGLHLEVGGDEQFMQPAEALLQAVGVLVQRGRRGPVRA